jgi:hypothetical protein
MSSAEKSLLTLACCPLHNSSTVSGYAAPQTWQVHITDAKINSCLIIAMDYTIRPPAFYPFHIGLPRTGKKGFCQFLPRNITPDLIECRNPVLFESTINNQQF